MELLNYKHIPELADLVVTQTPTQLMRNQVEIEGVEFSEFILNTSPSAVRSFVLLHRSTEVKERVRAYQKAENIEFQQSLLNLLKMDQQNTPNTDQQELTGTPKEYIPFEGFHYNSAVGNLKKLRSMILCISSCLVNKHASIGYFGSKNKDRYLDEFTEVLTLMCIDRSVWRVNNGEIWFSNGSKLIFLDAIGN